MDDVVVLYEDKQVSVPKEVADFLEQDRKRAQAEEKRDERHLSKSEFETVLSRRVPAKDAFEDSVLWNLRLESLRTAVAGLSEQDKQLIDLRYYEEMTQEEIGKILGISKMAVSKRLKKLHQRLRRSVN